MIETVLSHKLQPLIEAEKTLRRRRLLGMVLGGGALIAGVLLALAHFGSWWSWGAVSGLTAAVVIAALVCHWIAEHRSVEVKTLARKIEEAHPDLEAALLTAVEQKPDPRGQLGYLQERIVFQAVDHAVKHDWVRQVSRARLTGAGFFQLAMLLVFAGVMLAVLGEMAKREQALAQAGNPDSQTQATGPLPPYEISVTPGNTEVERGARLIVEAKFGDARVPPEASVVIREPGKDGTKRERIPLKQSLDETVFAGIVPRVDHDALYRIEFDGERSGEYLITTYVHPELEKANATVTPPEYTGQPARTIEDTREVSLLEGSGLAWSIQINKPVAAAELFGEDESVLPLSPSPLDPTLLATTHRPEKSQRYRLHLVDEKDRANKQPPWFTVRVKKNLPPKLDFVFPKRDVQVSALQELPVEASVWDDIGVTRAGAIFAIGDETREIKLADSALPGGNTHPLHTLFDFETIGAKPRDVVAYHLWAEDIGPEGKPRRAQSDMFFAEVRHFEDIFREQENMGGQPGDGPQGQTAKLLELQKEVMNATWNLIRRHEMGAEFSQLEEDTGVVRNSQGIALDQAREAMTAAEDPDLAALLGNAAEHMSRAVEELAGAIESRDGKPLHPAHAAERKAYESLIQARSREHNVTRAQDARGEGGGLQQEQLMQLELKQKELRYEKESQAQDPEQTAEQQENLAVLNRLKELARRQEAVAKKIQELEAALQEAETEENRKELERQLKRLQEEQEQLLRDLDELTGRMDREENRAQMAKERARLQETRETIREASQQLEEGRLADATNAATRAQREMEEVRDDFRKKTSRRFGEEMRAMRKSARDLAEKQEEIGQKYETKRPRNSSDPFDPENSPLKNAELVREIEEQRDTLAGVLEQMRQLSEDAEGSEPLLSGALYEAYRKVRMSGIDDSLAEAGDLTRYNRRELAQESERAAARGIEELKSDVEAAAEKVLGSEADALRAARSELDKLIENARQEAERLASEDTGQPRTPGEDPSGLEAGPGEQGQSPEPGRKPGQGETSPQPTGAEGEGKPAPESQLDSRGDRRSLAESSESPSPEGPPQASVGRGRSSHGGPNWGGDDRRRREAGPPDPARSGRLFFFQGSEETESEGPITGGDYERWSDRLRNIESMVEQDDIRNDLARVLDNARALRIEFKRNNFAPQASAIAQRITHPLVEIRGRVSEEIAKLDKENPLAPIDRDPVPQEFRDLVRRYYQELGSGK